MCGYVPGMNLAPIPVRVSRFPPLVEVGGVDVTASVKSFELAFVDGVSSFVFEVDPVEEVSIPCHVTRLVRSDGADFLAGLDARTIDGWAVSGGMSTTMGERIMLHLRDWVMSRPQSGA